MPRRAYLHEEAVSLVEFALTGSLVTAQARERCRDLVDDRLSAARLRLVDQRGHFRQRALHVGCATRTLRAEQGSRAGQQSVHLEEAATALPRVGQGLIGQFQRGAGIVLTELRFCQEAKCPRGGSEADSALPSKHQRAPL